MLTCDCYLFPAVKRAVSLLAVVTRYALVACAVMALAELVLLPLHLVLPGIVCGLVSAFLAKLQVALLLVVAVWCHVVLLAGQGVALTRWLVWLGGLLAPLVPISWGYSLLTGELLLYRQGELPMILGVFLLVAAVLNIPRMAAAPGLLQVRVVAVPVLMLAAVCLDVPGLLLPCAAVKVLLASVASFPLRELARVAPLVISLPERD